MWRVWVFNHWFYKIKQQSKTNQKIFMPFKPPQHRLQNLRYLKSVGCSNPAELCLTHFCQNFEDKQWMTLFCMLNFAVPSDKKLIASPPTKHIHHMVLLMFPISRNWEIAGKHGRAIFRAGKLRDLDKNFKFCFLTYLFCYHNSDCRTFKHRTALMFLERGKRKNACYQLCCHYMVKPNEDKNGRTKLSPFGLLTDSNEAHRAITAQKLKAKGPGWKSLYWSQSVQTSQDSMRLKGKKYFPFRPCYLFLLPWLVITKSWCLHLMFERPVCCRQECDCLRNWINMELCPWRWRGDWKGSRGSQWGKWEAFFWG